MISDVQPRRTHRSIKGRLAYHQRVQKKWDGLRTFKLSTVKEERVMHISETVLNLLRSAKNKQSSN